MSYSVGKNEEGTVLIVGSPSDGGFTSTLTMGEDATVQLIKLLAATLTEHKVEIFQDIRIEE
jgi:hypothetical protein